jgi:two-component system, chemotaxis family, chemotaxis protein CheY
MDIKALVVDDFAIVRKIVTRSLNAVGISDVVEASNGQEALEKFQQLPFQLVMTDWNMPVKTGLELVRDIRALGSRVPVMMITTEGEKERVLEAIQAGATDYLVKPFENDVLRQKLEKYCR